MFNEFPYTNFHELNLDWIIQEFKRLENLGVLSVNGQTGEVVLYQDARIQLPDVSETQWNIYRGAAGLLSGIEFRPDGAYLISGTQRLKFLTKADIPEEAGVISVNGKTGIVNLTGEDIPAAEDDPLTISDALDVVNDAIYDVDDRVDNTQAGISIIADGSDHPVINEGQYVYIKNHTSLSEGLYTARSAIPANTAITAANVTAVNNGASNDLLSKITGIKNDIGDNHVYSRYILGTSATTEYINLPNSFRGLIYGFSSAIGRCFALLCITYASGSTYILEIAKGDNITITTEQGRIKLETDTAAIENIMVFSIKRDLVDSVTLTNT